MGAQVTISLRRVWISFASGYPYQNIFYQIFARIRALSFSG
ncbi:MAG: hypothetical protein HYS07_06435 [Chlamydiae bacterium]|nr:hypothetical protein [Chlamydiota bacterium]MBI3276559.1 hypothetical protein [Chlamydiota bacterium]